MPGATDLSELLRGMTPVLGAEPYGYAVASDAQEIPLNQVFAVVREDEGITIVASFQTLLDAGFHSTDKWARITLQIHSSLSAVGLTAAFAAALGNQAISANVIAGFHHDHIFVQWNRRHEALDALLELSNSN